MYYAVSEVSQAGTASVRDKCIDYPAAVERAKAYSQNKNGSTYYVINMNTNKVKRTFRA